MPLTNDPLSRSDSGGDYSCALDEKPLGRSAGQQTSKVSLLSVRKKLCTPDKTSSSFRPLLGTSSSANLLQTRQLKSEKKRPLLRLPKIHLQAIRHLGDVEEVADLRTPQGEESDESRQEKTALQKAALRKSARQKLYNAVKRIARARSE